MTAYVWPAISHDMTRTEADWDALEATGAYSRREFARMKNAYEDNGILFVGYSITIMENGDWVAFVVTE